MRGLLMFPELQAGTPGHPHGGRVELTLVVGIAWPGGDREAWHWRTRDFLPPPENLSMESMRARLLADPGGADAFLDFLTRELPPALAAHYPLRPDRTTLAGTSLGGYFTLYALMRQPQAFQRYVAISPSLWYDDARLLADMARARPSSGRVLLALAQDELPGYPDRSATMLAHARSMRDLLAGYGYGSGHSSGHDGQSLRYLEVENEDHMSLYGALMPTIVHFVAMP